PGQVVQPLLAQPAYPVGQDAPVAQRVDHLVRVAQRVTARRELLTGGQLALDRQRPQRGGPVGGRDPAGEVDERGELGDVQRRWRVRADRVRDQREGAAVAAQPLADLARRGAACGGGGA